MARPTNRREQLRAQQAKARSKQAKSGPGLSTTWIAVIVVAAIMAATAIGVTAWAILGRPGLGDVATYEMSRDHVAGTVTYDISASMLTIDNGAPGDEKAGLHYRTP